MAKDNKDPYSQFLSSLSPSARKAVTTPKQPKPVDDERDDYGLWRRSLGGKAKEWVDSQVELEEKPEDDVLEDALCYGCVEVASGEFPVIRLFRTAEAMARHVGKLEGQDVCVVPFWGCVMKLSKGPQRLLLMPDHETALTVPRSGEGRVDRLSLEDVDFDWQDDGFVGPYELANSAVLEEQFEEQNDEEDEDDEEDEEDDEETASP